METSPSSDLIKNVLAIIPPLSFTYHKGEAGRIGVVGGCQDYTGAPYFAGISALKVGCDLVHIFCTSDAAPAIKSYSPELMVHPILGTETTVEEFLAVVPRLHSLVIGPGLGRDPHILQVTRQIIAVAKERQMPLVFDADALFDISQDPDIIRGYRRGILTPNVAEFKRLYSVVVQQPPLEETSKTHEDVKLLSSLLGNVTIVKKGSQDVISDGESIIVCKETGSPRRCGGQGDILSGSMGVFNYWAHNFYSNLSKGEKLPYSATVVAALAACMLARKCNWLAFQKCRRSMTTSDMISEIRTAFPLLFPD